MSILLRRACRAGWLLLAAGLLLQFGLKDHLPGLALLFYALPKPCLLALATVLALWPGATGRKRLAALIVAVALGLSWLGPLLEPSPTPAAPQSADDFRLLVWNVARPLGPHTGLIELVRARYRNVFEARPSGLAETWPLGLPLLSLDQVWVGPDWQVVELEKLWRIRDSDHAALWVVLRRGG